jgi:nicotinate-nucleotide pyrophosphorylase
MGTVNFDEALKQMTGGLEVAVKTFETLSKDIENDMSKEDGEKLNKMMQDAEIEEKINEAKGELNNIKTQYGL